MIKDKSSKWTKLENRIKFDDITSHLIFIEVV